MEGDGAKYKYTPLNSPHTIRVLDLSRQSYNSDSLIFDCSFRNIDLENTNHPDYYALSYTWSLPITQNESALVRPSPLHIRCNGKIISIQENLFDCLYQLEHLPNAVEEPDTTQYIWIDAICINQEDLEERGSQVAMMQKIYTKAKGVLIWLGRQDRHSSTAIPLIKKLSEVADGYLSNTTDFTGSSMVNASQLNDEEFFKSVNIPQLSMTDWKSISEFFARSWFHRLWTVQEMVMGQRHGDLVVLCGDTTLSLDEDIAGFIMLALSKGWMNTLRILEYTRSRDLSSMNNLGIEISMAMGAIYNAREENRPGSLTRLFQHLFDYHDGTSFLVAKFAWMLHMCRQKAATDDRDRVFACSGMITKHVKPENWHLLGPDYSKPVEKVLLDASTLIIQSLGNLSLLSFIEDRSLRCHGKLPSWIPDFRVASRPTPLLMTRNHDVFRNNRAMKLNLPGPLMLIRGAYLNVNAFKLDKLAGTHFDLNNHLHNHKLCGVLLAAAKHSEYPTGETWLEAFMKTLAAGQPYQLDLDDTDTTQASSEEGFDSLLPSFLHLLKVEIAQERWNWNNEEPTANSWWEANGRFAQLCDSNGGLPTREDFDATFAVFTSLYPAHQQHRDNPFIEDEDFNKVLHKPKLQFVNQMAMSYFFRAFVQLFNGFMGLAPLSAKPGDEVWIIARSKVPLVLRQSNDDRYEVIGEAYIHGIMKGELFGRGDEHVFQQICLK